MALWFETKIRYDRIQENGSVKKVNEPYLVDALTFTDAEARIIEKITPFISGEFSVSAVKKTKISEIFFDESDYADKFYMVKVNFVTLDEKSGKEKNRQASSSCRPEILTMLSVGLKTECRALWPTMR